MTSGDTLNHYRILRPIGKGGMGEVFLAEDTVLGRKVAIKFLPQSMQQDADARKRFLHEARAAAALDHPFICRIYDTGEFEGRAFIAMEYIAGETLGARLAKGPIPLRDALQTASEIAEALEEAHDKGIVHRDLKPTNIMLTPQGHAKIMDFGLAKQVSPADGPQTELSTQTLLTKTGAIVGTLAYMSPEQARGEPVDTRSDIFSFGVLLYEMLSGSHPFQRRSQIETLSAILRDASPRLHLEATATPSALSSLLNKAMAKDIATRYQSVKDLARDLQLLKEQLLPKPRWIKWVLSGAGLLVIALLLGTWWIARRAPPPAQAAARPPVSALIADFQNRTGDSIFDGTLESSFSIALEGASFITAYDRGQGRRIGRRLQPTATGLDESLARLVAQREGINIVVSGSISSRTSGYRISIKAIDAASGNPLISRETDIANKEGVLAAVGKLAASIRKALGDTTPESVQLAAGETFTAGSLEAAHRYAEAQDMQWAGKTDEAIRYYSLAVQLDPDLGRAYAGLAVIYANWLQRPEADKYYKMALARIDRMSDREKYRTRGGYYLMVRNVPKAIEEFSNLVKQYPADTAGIYNLALSYFYGRDMTKALAELRHAIEHYPKNLFYHNNMALFAMYAGDFAAAEREAHGVIEQNPSYDLAYVALALSELAQGRPDQTAEQYKRLGALSARCSSTAALGLADLALYEGRSSEAAAILEKGIAGDLANNSASAAAHKLLALAETRLIAGKTASALDAAGRAAESNKEESVAFAAAQIYIEAGQEAKARALAADLGQRLEPDPQAYAKLIQGESELKRGNAHGAITLFQEAQKLADMWLGHFALGRAYLEAGAFTEAHSEFETCLRRRGEATAVFLDDLPSYRYFPPIYYHLGRAQEGLKSPAAADSYRAFLAIKEKGGEDPLIADARRRLNSQP